jgi:hypothetical protein
MPNVFRAALFRASRLGLQANAKALRPSAIKETGGKAWHSGAKLLRFRDIALVATQ